MKKAEELEYEDSQFMGPTFEVSANGETTTDEERKLKGRISWEEDFAVGVRKVLVMLVCWEGSCDGTRDEVFNDSDVDGKLVTIMKKVEDFFAENSNGKLQLEIEAVPGMIVAAGVPIGACMSHDGHVTTTLDNAVIAAGLQGFVTDDYLHRVVIGAPCPTLGFGGLGFVGQPGSYVGWNAGKTNEGTFAHEWGIILVPITQVLGIRNMVIRLLSWVAVVGTLLVVTFWEQLKW